MPTIQIKTLELLIIHELRITNGYNERVHNAFTQLRKHFSDEEYLYGIGHSEVIKKIYIDNFYKYRSTEALALELHIDTKTLLVYRKTYLRLFTKYYLDLPAPTKTDLFLLYEQLKEDIKTAEKQNSSPPLPKISS